MARNIELGRGRGLLVRSVASTVMNTCRFILGATELVLIALIVAMASHRRLSPAALNTNSWGRNGLCALGDASRPRPRLVHRNRRGGVSSGELLVAADRTLRLVDAWGKALRIVRRRDTLALTMSGIQSLLVRELSRNRRGLPMSVTGLINWLRLCRRAVSLTRNGR